MIASYQNTVLTANEEVENALVSFLQTQERVRSLAASAQEVQQALELELLNFQEGETDFSGVFVLQGDLALKQDQFAAAQGDVVTSLVAVYKALGGGWEIRCSGHPLRTATDQSAGRSEDRETPPSPLPELMPAPQIPESTKVTHEPRTSARNGSMNDLSDITCR